MAISDKTYSFKAERGHTIHVKKHYNYSDSYDGNFQLAGVTLENGMHLGLHDRSHNKNENENEYNTIYHHIKTFIFNKLGKDLETFIQENKSRQDFYTTGKFFSNLYDINMKKPEVKYCDVYMETKYTEIESGIVECKLSQNTGYHKYCTLKFDLIENKIVDFAGSLVDKFYNKFEQQKIIAITQVNEGNGNKLFMELAKMNAWLDGKKSITLTLDNGEEYKVKSSHGGDLNISRIIWNCERFNNDDVLPVSEWTIYNNSNITPPIREKTYFQRLRCMKFSKTVYQINHEVFK